MRTRDWSKSYAEQRDDFEREDRLIQLVRALTAKNYHVIEISWRKDWKLGLSDKDMMIIVRGRGWSLGKSRYFRFESRGLGSMWSTTDWEEDGIERWIAELPVWQPWWISLAHGVSRFVGVE